MHFVLFGMQWCQPVWDGIDDPDPAITEGIISGPRCNNNVFVNGMINGGWVRGVNMHMVSKCIAGRHDIYGHYYGFFDNTGNTHRYDIDYDGNNRPHQGVDIYSGPNGNNPVFAIHGGKLRSATHTEGYAHHAQLSFTSEANPCFLYAHLGSRPTKTYVMAGEIFGSCGRTGYNNDTSSPSHLHFELLNATRTKVEFSQVASMISNMGVENERLFPGNKLPIILPCMCHGNSLASIGCNYGSNNTTTHENCWAVREFPYTETLLGKSSNDNTTHHPDGMPIPSNEPVRFICPYVLHQNADKTAQLQVRLRFIIENAGLSGMPDNAHLNAYSIRNNDANSNDETNGIDAIFGETSKSWIRAIIQTYQDILDNDHADKTIEVNISGTLNHAELFRTRYVTENNPLSNNSLVDGAYDWFMGLDYTNICYNTIINAPNEEEDTVELNSL